MKFSSHTHRHALVGVILLLLFTVVPQACKAVPTAAPPPLKLDIRLLVTAEPEKVFKATKGPDGKHAQAQPVTVAPRGKRLGAVIFFKDCQPDASGKCNVDVDLQGMLPSGVLFENRKAAELWRNKSAPRSGLTQVGAAMMNITIEAKDPAGIYRVIAVAHDRNNGTESRAEATFEVK